MNLFAKISGAAFLLFSCAANLSAEKEADASAGKGQEISIPIPIGHGAKGVKLPYRNEEGKLEMDFSMDSAFRIDNEHLEMKMVKMETYGEDGKPEMTIEMPSSVLDLNTRIVKSSEPVLIRRSDIEVSGETMEFDTKTRSGKIVGKVRMLIYNLDKMTEPNKP